jgi:hypothetical protein
VTGSFEAGRWEVEGRRRGLRLYRVKIRIVTKRWRSGGGSKGERGVVNKWVDNGEVVSEGKRHLFGFI